MIISIDAKRSPDRVQHAFRIKVLEKAGMQDTNSIIKAVYDKLTENIVVKGEELEVIPLKLGKLQGFPLH